MRRGRGDPRWDDGPEWDKREDDEMTTTDETCPYCRERGSHAPNCWAPSPLPDPLHVGLACPLCEESWWACPHDVSDLAAEVRSLAAEVGRLRPRSGG
jgi:hypothetical protein